jgi:hypothetical protein
MLQVDDFEHHQSWRIGAVAGMWEVPSHSYLGEHRNRTCRRLHFLGSTLALVCLAMLLISGRPQYLLYGLLCGYGFAWLGHFVFEKNRPASFKRPLYSFIGDWAMYRDIWLGRIKF